MYNKKAHIHFVGIGGIGMSGIATILKYQGYDISGCDLDQDQESIKNLRAIGCHVYHGNNTHHCQDKTIDILVYSSAIKKNNPELLAAQQRGIPTISRALMLAELMRTKYSVAIAGSHGKTTTTSLVSHILLEAKMDPTIVIGGHLKTLSTNARIGNGDFLVAEADESDRSLINLQATLAIVTNIDLEHLETYKNLDDIKQTFLQFLNNLPFYGKAILCADDPVIKSMLPLPHIKTILYGFDRSADFFATDIELKPDYSTFSVWKKNHTAPLGTIKLPIPGSHNVLNALAAISLSDQLTISFETIAQALKTFKGIERRFSFRGSYMNAEIFDDYGHHPKEIYHTLQVAKRRSKNKLRVVFQPHRYSRTQQLWQEFITTFMESNIDELIITDIYPASEQPIDSITSKRLVEEIQKNKPHFNIIYAPYEPNFTSICQTIQKGIQPNDLILLLGAGKIYKLASLLVK